MELRDRIAAALAGEVEVPSYRAAFAWCALPESGCRVLDFGCSEGFHSALWRKGGNQVTGVDVRPAAISKAQARYPGMEFRLVGESMDLPSHSFDWVVMLDVIEHVNDERVTFNELRRILAPGGRLVLTAPAANLFGDWWDQDNLFFTPAMALKSLLLGRKPELQRHRHYTLAHLLDLAGPDWEVELLDYSGGLRTAPLAGVHKLGSVVSRRLLPALHPTIDRILLARVKDLQQASHFSQHGEMRASKVNLVLRLRPGADLAPNP